MQTTNTKHDNIHSRKKQCSGASLCWDCGVRARGAPKTTGAKGESVRRKEIVSVWLPEVMRLTDSVTWVTGGRDWPQRALTKMGELSGTTGTPNWSAVLWSKKLPSAPESIKALHVNAARSTSSWTGRRVAAEEEDFSKMTPPSVTSYLLAGFGFYRALRRNMTSRTAV